MHTYEVVVRGSRESTAIKEIKRLIHGFGDITHERSAYMIGGTEIYRFITITVTNKTQFNKMKLMNDERLMLLNGKHEHWRLVLENFDFEFIDEPDDAT